MTKKAENVASMTPSPPPPEYFHKDRTVGLLISGGKAIGYMEIGGRYNGA